MAIFACPHCGTKGRTNQDIDGKTVTCPNCGEKTRMPPAVPGKSTSVSESAESPSVAVTASKATLRPWIFGAIAGGVIGSIVGAAAGGYFLMPRGNAAQGGAVAAAPEAMPAWTPSPAQAEAFVPDPDPVKRLFAAVAHLSNTSLQDRTRDQFFRIGMHLRDKKTGKIAPFTIGYVVARDHAEARAIAAPTLNVRPSTIDVVEARIHDPASAYTDKTIGQNILRERHLAYLAGDEARAMRIIIDIGHEYSTEAEYQEANVREFREELKALAAQPPAPRPKRSRGD